MEPIKLEHIFPIKNLEDYKLHCAVSNGIDQPLDIFADDREKWHDWNRSRRDKNDMNRKYIYSLAKFYPEKDVWLFGGVYRVHGLTKTGYKIELEDIGQEFIGRLKIKLKLEGRNVRVNLEKQYHKAIVTEILPEPYSGERFPGYEEINLPFERLETIYKNQKNDWLAALGSIKGVYLITDRATGKKYVGSAYGDTGIWSRWENYIETGHGKNKELKQLIAKKGLDYARKNFSFTLLEYRQSRVDDNVIIERECFWKESLLSRGDYGYNRN